jgi:predicted DNA-binding transcriptional regulator AlpA
MNDAASLRLQAPAGANVARPSQRNRDILDVHDVAHELGVSVRTVEREIRRPGSKFPQPYRVGLGRKRHWLRSNVEAYRAALAVFGGRIVSSS